MMRSGSLFCGRCTQMTMRLRTIERYATLLEVNRAAITQPGLNEMFQGMCTAVKRVMPYDRAGLSLYAPEKNALKLVAHDGCGPDSFYRIGVMLDCKESHHGWVFEHQKPIVRRNLERDHSRSEQGISEKALRSSGDRDRALKSEARLLFCRISNECVVCFR